MVNKRLEEANKKPELEPVDFLFEEWATKWLPTRRFAGLQPWQKNILDQVARGDVPDTYFSVDMSAFNSSVMLLENNLFGALVVSCCKQLGLRTFPVKTIAHDCGVSRQNIYDNADLAREKTINIFKKLVNVYAEAQKQRNAQ